MIALTVGASWLLLACLAVAAWNLAKAVARWLDETESRADLRTLRRHHDACAAVGRTGETTGTARSGPSATDVTTVSPVSPFDWADQADA